MCNILSRYPDLFCVVIPLLLTREMLLDVVIQVVEGLNLLQLVNGDGNLVGCLHNGNEVYNTDTIQAECFLEVRIGCELTLFYFKLFFKQGIYLINDFLSCHNSNSNKSNIDYHYYLTASYPFEGDREPLFLFHN